MRYIAGKKKKDLIIFDSKSVFLFTKKITFYRENIHMPYVQCINMMQGYALGSLS